MNSQEWYTRTVVCERLQISETVLLRYEKAGLVRPIAREHEFGYDPRQLRRLWSIVSLQQDLGVNLAGVRAILRLRRQLLQTRRQLREIAALLEQRMSPNEGGTA